MTFNSALYTGKSGCYAAAMVDPLFNPWIAMIRAALGLGDDIDMEPHATIIYSKEKVLTQPVPQLPLEADAHVHEIEFFEGHKGDVVIALGVDCPELHDCHELMKTAGAEHSYPEYKAHITLARIPEMTQELKNRISDLNLVLGTKPVSLLFSHFYVEDLS